MIESLSGRRAFARLRDEGQRSGRGPVRVISRRDAAAPTTRIAFAIPRTVGNAVARNRIRRRIRAVLHDVSVGTPDFPARGDHMIRVTAPLDQWPYDRLRENMSDLLAPTPTR